MTVSKETAIMLAKRGVKMTHRFFTLAEWFVIDQDDNIVLDGGSKMSQADFWMIRNTPSWIVGYSKFNGLTIEDLRIGDKVLAVCPNSKTMEVHRICSFIPDFSDRVMLKIDKDSLSKGSTLHSISDNFSMEYRLRDIKLP